MQISRHSLLPNSYAPDAGGARPAAARAAEQRERQPDQAREIQQLRARDREVRTHEQAHQAAGGQHVNGGVQFDYQRGPDGRYYAVGGEVSISTSAIPGDPEATLRKMEVVRRAALAPAEPSAQDLQVAAQATAAANQARVELARQRTGGYGDGDAPGGTPAARAYDAAAQASQDTAQVLDLLA